MKKTEIHKVINDIKLLVRNPNHVHLLQDPQALTLHFGLDTQEQCKIEKALQHLSEKESKFIRTHILEPFVHQFGNFCKTHPEHLRWPSFEELALSFKHMTLPFLSRSFIIKRTRFYTLRKIVKDIPEWNASMHAQKGPIKEERKLQFKQDIPNLIQEYLQTLKDEQKRNSTTAQLRKFAQFFVKEYMFNLNIANDPSLLDEVVKKFESLNEEN